MKQMLLTLVMCSICLGQSSGVKPMLGSQIDWSHPLARGLVGCWLMNEGCGSLLNSFAPGLSLTLIGNAMWTTGRHGPCLSCPSRSDDGASVVYPFVGPTTACTVTAWFRTTDTRSNQTLISWGADSGTLSKGIWFSISPLAGTTGILRFYTSSVTVASGSMGLASADGLWHFYAITWDGTTVTYYMDGRPFDTDAASGTAAYTPAADSYLTIGAVENGAGSWGAQGDIDVPCVWSRALSVSEVAQLYCDQFAVFQQERPEFYVTAGAAPSVSSQVIIVSKAAVPLMVPLGVIVSMAWYMRKKE